MKESEWFVDLRKKRLFIYAVVALFIVLTLPSFIRFYHSNDSLIGSESYYHFRAARELLKHGSYNFFSPPQDIQDISYSPRAYSFNPYQYLLVYTSKILSLSTASRIVPFLLGVITLLLFNLILRNFVSERYKRHIALLLLVTSPAFIYTFTVSNPHSAAITLSLLGFYLFLKKSRIEFILSVFCFVIVSLFSLFNTVLVLLVLLAYILTKKAQHNRFFVVLFIMAIFSFARKFEFFYNYTYTPYIDLVGNLFSDLGGVIGFGIFSIMLAIYCVVTDWDEKSGFVYFFLISLLLLLSVSVIGNFANIYLMFFVSVAAGLGFVRLYESEWSVQFMKSLALLVLVCGLLFSTFSFITRLSSIEPDSEFIASLDWLGSNTFKDGFVLSHYDNGYLISTIARNPVLVDSLSAYGYDQKFLYKVQDTLFYSRKIKDTKQLLDAYKIKYVFITPEMTSGLVWTRPDEGMLFLLKHSSVFNRVYNSSGIDIYEVTNKTVE
jgi:hypothetical protein